MMALMQMDNPGLSEPYFVSSFVAGLREGIKHYLIPHSPQTLSDTYWKAKELEKGILIKRSLLTSSTPTTKPNPSYQTTNQYKTPYQTPQLPPNKTLPANNNPNPSLPKPIPPKPKEPGKCWGCKEPWTPEHKFVCTFRRAINAMAIDPGEWMSVEQAMEEQNHSLLQVELSHQDNKQPPQLLLISSHAALETSSATTFLVLVTIGGRKGISLIDSGSTDTFMDYTFASKVNCRIVTTVTRQVKVAAGGYLTSGATLSSTAYFIQNESFNNEFKLLALKAVI
jgi:hypothetical protein